MLRVTLAVVIFLAMSTGDCAASGSRTELLVTIESASTRAPIVGASIAVLGTSPGAIFMLITNKDGKAIITDLEEGPYRLIVQANGFRALRATADVLPSQRTSIQIQLRPALSTIGHVAAKSSILHESLNNGPIRKVSPSLADALNHLADVDAHSNDRGAGLSASLRNGDPSATSYSINGVPLAGSGAALSINTDLLASASVNQDRDNVDFSYLAPTLAPRFVTTVQDGGFGESLFKTSLQATLGTIGIAVAHTVRGVDSALNGQTYLDASGLAYRHVGAVVTVGNYVKAAAPVGNWTASALVADSHTVSNPIPSYFDGLLPAGDGPGTIATSHSLNVVATANGLVGTTAVSLGSSSFIVDTIDDQSTRLVNLIKSPLLVSGNIRGTDFTVAALRSVSPRMSFRATFTDTEIAVGGSSAIDGFQLADATLGQSTSTLTLRSDLRISDAVKLYAQGDLLRSSFASWSPSATAGFTASGSSGIRYSGQLSIGRRSTAGSDPRNEQGFLDAASATYDCADGIVTVQAPGDTNAQASFVQANLAYSHDRAGGYFSIIGYYDLLRSAMLTNAVVPISSESPAFAPVGYADALLAGFDKYGRCNRGVPAADRVYLIQDVNGVSSQNIGLSVAGSRTLSRWLIVSFGAFLSSARLLGGDSRLSGATSPYQFGKQIPGRPFVKGNIVVDYALPRMPELLVDAEYLGANNARNLPPNTTINVGLEKILSPSVTVNLIATNVFNAYAGAYVTTRNAVFVPTPAGLFPALAAPFPPASIHLGVTLALDRRPDP